MTQSEPIRVSPETCAVTAGKELSPSSWHQVQPVEYKPAAVVGIPAICGRHTNTTSSLRETAMKGERLITELLEHWIQLFLLSTATRQLTLRYTGLQQLPFICLWVCILSKSAEFGFSLLLVILAGAGVSKLASLTCQHQEEWGWLEYLGLARPLSQFVYVYIFKQNVFIFHSLPSSRAPHSLLE